MTSDQTAGASPQPTLRFVAGDPTPEEIALVTALVTALPAGSDEETVATEPSGWGRPRHARLRRPRSWRESRLPL